MKTSIINKPISITNPKELIRSEETFEDVMRKVEDSIYPTIVKYLDERLSQDRKEIREMVMDYTNRRGRYIRPKILWIVAKMFGAEDKNIILPASAIQLSEDFVLQIDDMLDGTQNRRGKPAFHRLYGFENTVITPQFIIGVVWNMMHDYSLQNGAKGEEVYRRFMKYSDITFEGQAIENMFKPRQTSSYPEVYQKPLLGIRDATYEIYLEIIRKKTAAYTIYGPAQAGAVIGNATEEQLNLIKEIGTLFGIAFQIKDDIADYKEDIKEGQPTIITIHAYSKASDAEKKLIESVFSKLPGEKSEEEIEQISSIVGKYGSVGYALEKYGMYASEATRLYAEKANILPSNGYTEMLFKLFNEYVA